MNLPTRDHAMFSDDEIAEIARSVERHDFERIAPPPQVWNNILAEVEVEIASQEAIARRQSRSRFTSARLLSAAAATLLMVGVAVAVVMWSGDDDAGITEVAAATMTTDGLPVSTTATADARFVCEADECFVEIQLSEIPDAGADDLELWVINGDVTDMYSLGNITADTERFPLPHGITAGEYPIVDISVEPDDGDATHSGQSVLRGTFDQT